MEENNKNEITYFNSGGSITVLKDVFEDEILGDPKLVTLNIINAIRLRNQLNVAIQEALDAINEELEK
jgi:hypothetical protein